MRLKSSLDRQNQQRCWCSLLVELVSNSLQLGCVMLLSRAIEPVSFSEEEAGKAIMGACDDQQRVVLIAMANAVDDMSRKGGSWPMQCRSIVDGCRGPGSGLSANDRSRIASMLGCLMDHLTE
jgi:hypothetical protein